MAMKNLQHSAVFIFLLSLLSAAGCDQKPQELLPEGSVSPTARASATLNVRRQWEAEVGVLKQKLEACSPLFTLLDADNELITAIAGDEKGLKGVLLVLENRNEHPEKIKEVWNLQAHAEDLFKILGELESDGIGGRIT